jgi:hypothetical protein
MIFTIEQIQESYLLILAMKETLLESVEGTAKVAKAIQTLTGCEFKEAVVLLGEIILEFSIV